MKTHQRVSSREIYRNPYIAAEVHDIVHPTGVAGEHLLVVTEPVSAVVVADGGDLLFTRQARFGAQSEMVEIVKGAAEAGETPLECAQRELREELGAISAHWEPLGVLYEIPSIMDKPVNLFLARSIEHVDAQAEEIESIDLVRIPEQVAIAAAASGQLNDAVTVAALLRYGFASRILKI